MAVDAAIHFFHPHQLRKRKAAGRVAGRAAASSVRDRPAHTGQSDIPSVTNIRLCLFVGLLTPRGPLSCCASFLCREYAFCHALHRIISSSDWQRFPDIAKDQATVMPRIGFNPAEKKTAIRLFSSLRTVRTLCGDPQSFQVSVFQR